MNIAEQRYNSTYGFVRINKLEKQADEVFGKDWKAEDDVNQIIDLLNYINRNDLQVSFIEDLKEDDIEVSKNEPRKILIEIQSWLKTLNRIKLDMDDLLVLTEIDNILEDNI